MHIAGQCAKHLIDHLDQRRGVAPRFVLPHCSRVPRLPQPVLCGIKQAYVGAAKAVDRLLRVAHQEHRRPRAIAAVGVEPAAQRRPLQRVGVLEFIEQQVLDARVKALVQIGGVITVSQKLRRLPLDIVEVDRGARRFEMLIGIDEGVAEHKGITVEVADAALQQCRFSVLHGAGEGSVQVQIPLFAGRAEPAALRCAGLALARLTALRQPNAAYFGERVVIQAADLQHTRQVGGLFLIGRRVAREQRGEFADPRAFARK